MIFALCLLIAYLADPGEPWGAVLIVGGAVLEVGEVALLRVWSKRLRRQYPPESPEGALVGSRATVVTQCRPNGQVKLRGEIWDAVCPAGAAVGDSVLVDTVDGLTLRVSPRGGTGRRRG